MSQVFTVATVDGSVYVGEYVGAQDGAMYLSTDSGVVRIEQSAIVNLTSKEVADE